MGSPSAFTATARTLAKDASSSPAARTLFHRIWRPALIATGLGLSATWTCLLGYGLVSFFSLMI